MGDLLKVSFLGISTLTMSLADVADTLTASAGLLTVIYSTIKLLNELKNGKKRTTPKQKAAQNKLAARSKRASKLYK